MAARSFNVLSLCSGVGGLELGISLAVPTARVVCYVEREAYACEVLARRMEEGFLDLAPIWTDLASFRGREWRGVVDCISAGFPCQPVSVAGRRLAQDDERWLWPIIARTIRDVGPRFVFLENVPALLDRGAGDVFGSLAEMGYVGVWGIFPACAVGASHTRERLFCLAYTNSGDWETRLRTFAQHEQHAIQQGGNGKGIKQWRLFSPPSVPRKSDGAPEWMDRVTACGNGVVPVVAAVAFTTLAERAGLCGLTTPSR